MPAWKTLARFLLRCGGLDLVRYSRRNALRILMYHRFTGMEKGFTQQCDHLLARYHPLSLSESLSILRDGKPFPDHSVVLTIDDGYGDFFTSAFPVLEARRIPAIMFLTTDFLDRRAWLWTDQVEYAVRQTLVREVEIPVAGHPVPLRLHLHSEAERTSALHTLKEALKAAPNRARVAVLAELPRFLRIDFPADPPAGRTPLAWDQVRAMARSGLIEFGGHTCSHPILSRLEDRQELEHEIGGCRARIEQELQRPATHFCYPNGRPEDIGPAVVEATRQAGYQSAVSLVPGLNTTGADAFMLRRIGVNPDVPFPWFEQVIAGFRAS
jgi:peptidoglycan/xylan/chitin deacetylase (PgdA/CDA1 family)